MRRLVVESGHVGRTVAERLSLLALESSDENYLSLNVRHNRAFDVEALTDAFYAAYCQAFSRVESATQGFPDTPEGCANRRAWAQRLLNRLMFLRFVEKKGWLAFDGATDYLAALYKKGRDESDFYQNRLAKLFFLGLNNPANVSLTNNSNNVLAPFIGVVPFLNGGLFEKTELDGDAVSVAPAVLGELIGPDGLFYRFNFTIDESTPFDVAVAVDPEMLGNVFEKLVISEELRSQSGSYYTPKTIVSFMCRESLKQFLGGYEKLVDEHDASELPNAECRELLQKLETVRVVDPACGSGAYLLGMLHELHGILRALDTKSRPVGSREDYDLKLQIIQRNLYGVDLQPFATEIARLRLWLSLAVDSREARALPNLKFKIESGDSLAAPSPTGIGTLFSGDAERLADQLAACKEEHFKAHGGRKAQLESEIETLEADLTRELSQNAAALPAGAFHWRVRFAEVFTPRHEAVTPFGTLNLGVQLPADPVGGGFDIVVANPPYGSKQPDAIRNLFFVPSSGDNQSKDAYGLFMARGLQLLRAGGTFSFIVSDTWRTIKSHKPLRKRLLRETTLLHVVDLPSWVFREPTVNTGIVTLKREAAPAEHHLVTADVRPLAPNDWVTLDLNLRVIAAHGPDAQTLDFARYTYPQSLIESDENASVFIASPQLYRLMSDPRFQKLGAIADVKVGLQTGDNEFYLRKRAAARGSYRILDEAKLLGEAEIAALSESEKRDGVDPEKYGGRHFVPYDKGGASDVGEGWLPNYYVPTEYFIDWSKTAVTRLRTATLSQVKRAKGESRTISVGDDRRIASRFQNSQFYFKNGLTFSRTGIYAPTFRYLSAGVFDTKSNGVFPVSLSPEFELGILNSALVRFIVKSYLCHTVQAEGDSILEIPMPRNAAEQEIANLVESIIEKQKLNARYDYWNHEQLQIDALVYELYGLDEADIREVELWFCRRYARLAKNQGLWSRVERDSADFLEWGARILARPASYWRSHPVLELVGRGEGWQLDFKECFHINRLGNKDAGALKNVLKTLASFANAGGGTVLLGVSNDGALHGLSRDIAAASRGDVDGLELKIRDAIGEKISPLLPPRALTIHFDTLRDENADKVVARLEVEAVRGITYLEGDARGEVWVRDGNRCRRLEGQSLVEWSQTRQ